MLTSPPLRTSTTPWAKCWQKTASGMWGDHYTAPAQNFTPFAYIAQARRDHLSLDFGLLCMADRSVSPCKLPKWTLSQFTSVFRALGKGRGRCHCCCGRPADRRAPCPARQGTSACCHCISFVTARLATEVKAGAGHWADLKSLMITMVFARQERKG